MPHVSRFCESSRRNNKASSSRSWQPLPNKLWAEDVCVDSVWLRSIRAFTTVKQTEIKPCGFSQEQIFKHTTAMDDFVCKRFASSAAGGVVGRERKSAWIFHSTWCETRQQINHKIEISQSLSGCCLMPALTLTLFRNERQRQHKIVTSGGSTHIYSQSLMLTPVSSFGMFANSSFLLGTKRLLYGINSFTELCQWGE